MTNSLNIILTLPEIIVLAMVCVILLSSVFSKSVRLPYFLTQITLIAAAYATWQVAPTGPSYAFDHSFLLDSLSTTLKLFVYLAVFFTMLYSERYLVDKKMLRGEFYVLALLATLGMMVLISSANLLTLYLGLELMSLPVYAMVAMRRDNQRCIEAAMKYFVMGALASAVLLFGFSFIFGIAHSLDLQTIYATMVLNHAHHFTLLIIAMVFVIIALAFKLGAAPFHMWVPDVYEGAPAAVTLFISAAPKIAAFALVIRFLYEAMGPLAYQWQPVLIALSLLSMAIGNIAAIAQTNLRRMLGYSSVAHMGYMLLGIIAATPTGYSASMFYIISYAIMSLASLGLIVLLSSNGQEITDISDLAGLNQRHPWVAFLLMLTLFSMAGIPPLVGFMAKVGVLEAVIGVHLVWLAATAIIFAVIGSYYYIKVVKVMYFEPQEHVTRLSLPTSSWVAISVNGLAVLLLGIFPGALFTLCHLAF